MMQFVDPTLQNALVEWHSSVSVRDRAESDNLWFESQVSDPRLRLFEAEAAGAVDAASLRRAHIDYWQNYVKTDEDLPHTFIADLEPAVLGSLDDVQRVVRIEAIERPLSAHGITFEQLKRAVEVRDRHVIDAFLRVWNTSTMRDSRPAFACFKSEVVDDLSTEDWPSRLRDRLGLAHYDCEYGPIQVALMEYAVEDVMRVAVKLSPDAVAFTVPTVIDSGPWPFFFPSPKTLNCGRTMSLYEVESDNDLLAEILHVRMPYRSTNLTALGLIDRAPANVDLRNLRNHHLFALRIASGDDGFGEEIPRYV